jgi:hypothetical protein
MTFSKAQTRWPAAALIGAAFVVGSMGCSSDSDADGDKGSTTSAASTASTAPSGSGQSTSTAPSTTSTPVTTAPTRPELPPLPEGLSPEPATPELPDGIYTIQVNSYDNENVTLNVNLVSVNTDVYGPDGKPYLVEDLDPFTLRDLPLASDRRLFLLPDGGGWQVEEVDDYQDFFSAIANRQDRPTPWDVNQNSVFAITVVDQQITQAMQIFLP